MVRQPAEPRTVKAATVREWLLWFSEQAEQHPTRSEIRRLNNRLTGFSQRAGAGTLDSGSGSATRTRDGQAFDWEHGEIAFAPRDGFGPKAIERLLARVVAVTGIRE